MGERRMGKADDAAQAYPTGYLERSECKQSKYVLSYVNRAPRAR